MAKYEVLKSEFVLQTLEKGTDVIICDFPTMRMISCNGLTVGAILAFAAKETTVFYKKVVADE